MEPVAPDVQQATGGARGRVAADDDRRGVAQELRPEALAEPARDRFWKASGSSQAARSSSVATTGRPEAIGRGLPPTAW